MKKGKSLLSRTVSATRFKRKRLMTKKVRKKAADRQRTFFIQENFN